MAMTKLAISSSTTIAYDQAYLRLRYLFFYQTCRRAVCQYSVQTFSNVLLKNKLTCVSHAGCPALAPRANPWPNVPQIATKFGKSLMTCPRIAEPGGPGTKCRLHDLPPMQRRQRVAPLTPLDACYHQAWHFSPRSPD